MSNQISKPVHHVKYASQPYVKIQCTGEMHYVSFNQLPIVKGIYYADGLNHPEDRVAYAFDSLKVTCKKCK